MKLRGHEATADLRRDAAAPYRRAGGRVRESAAPELGWLRGQQVGVHDAYKALRKKYPEAASFLLEKFSMNPDGAIVLGKR